MLTARHEVSDRVAGLDAGADDYLVKPFALEELLARLRALLRRTIGGDEPLSFADLTLDPGTREVHRGDRPIELTRTEFLLLELFLRNPRQVLTRDVIFDRVWGYDFGPASNSLEVYIGYLRRKTEAEGEPRLIHTVRGVGYALARTHELPPAGDAAGDRRGRARGRGRVRRRLRRRAASAARRGGHEPRQPGPRLRAASRSRTRAGPGNRHARAAPGIRRAEHVPPGDRSDRRRRATSSSPAWRTRRSSPRRAAGRSSRKAMCRTSTSACTRVQLADGLALEAFRPLDEVDHTLHRHRPLPALHRAGRDRDRGRAGAARRPARRFGRWASLTSVAEEVTETRDLSRRIQAPLPRRARPARVGVRRDARGARLVAEGAAPARRRRLPRAAHAARQPAHEHRGARRRQGAARADERKQLLADVIGQVEELSDARRRPRRARPRRAAGARGRAARRARRVRGAARAAATRPRCEFRDAALGVDRARPRRSPSSAPSRTCSTTPPNGVTRSTSAWPAPR